MKKTVWSNLLFTLAILLMAPCAVGQGTPSFWQLTDEAGLPSNTVFSLFQSKSGHLWVGTDNGIARYDGKNFETFTTEGLRGTSASNIVEDQDGRIWFNNFSGQILYVDNDSLHILKDWENRWLKGHFPNLLIGPDNLLYISSAFNPLIVYNKKDNSFKEIKVENPQSPYNSSFFGYYQGKILFSLSNQDGFRFYYYENGKCKSADSIDNALKKLYKTNPKRETNFTITNGKLALMDRFALELFWLIDGEFVEDKRIASIRKKGNIAATHVFENADGSLWIMTYNGAYYFPKGANEPAFNFLEGFSVGNLLKDNENNLWIASLSKGLFSIPDQNITTLSKIESHGFIVGSYFFTKDKNGIIYALMSNGVIQALDPKSGKTLFEIPMLINKEPEGFYYDYQRDMLIISMGKTFEYDLKQRRWNPHKEVFARSVKSFDVDFKGTMFAGGSSGLEAILTGIDENQSLYFKNKDNNGRKNKYWIENISGFYPNESPSSLRKKFYPFELLKSGRCRYVKYLKEQDAILACFTNGLYIINPEGIKEIFDPIDHRTLPVNKVLEISPGVYLIASVDKGILVYENGKITRRLDKRNGLPSNFIKAIKYHQGRIWAIWEKGLYSIPLNGGNVIQFTKEDGLLANDILDLELGDHLLFVATSRGIQLIPYSTNTLNAVPPKISLNKLFVNEHLVTMKKDLVLAYHENTIVFEFSGVALRSRGNFSFKYRLLGLDSSWIRANAATHQARFHSLAPGEYEFQIKTLNEDGVESLETATYKFEIEKPFWQTLGFILILIILVILLFILIYKIRIRQVHEKNRMNIEKSKLELENSRLELSKARTESSLRNSQLSALKSQMNPHFIFNALNSIQEYILLDEKKTAHLYLGKFSELMRLFLEMSNKEVVSLHEELKALRLYLDLEAVRFEDTFRYHIQVDQEIRDEDLRIPPMIIQPYVENAIKHGLLHRKINRRLDINFFLSGLDTLVCEITDNGIGRAASAEINKSKKHHSFSSSATALRLELLNQGRNAHIGVEFVDLTNDQNEALGTRVIIRIPISFE